MIIQPTQDQGAVVSGPATVPVDDRPRPEAPPGYELEERLGAGTFGEVWSALETNTGLRVAVKFLGIGRRAEAEALAAEVQKLAFLAADRHVVQLRQVGWEADPPFIVMEYMPGGSLEARLASGGPLPAGEAVTIGREIAVGLVHAHAKGIFHCDLKPANVLIDSDGRPRLADFGQARLARDSAPALGTLFYMAPEQADPKGLPDSRWDVYALGAVFYRMLTGSAPFAEAPGSEELNRHGSLANRLARYRRLLAEAPRPVGHRRVEGVDRALADLIDRCLAPDPRRRFAGPQAVVDALDVRAVWRAGRTLRLLAAVGSALVLLAAVAGVGAWAVGSAVDHSKAALTRLAADDLKTVGELAADRVAGAIEQRWAALGQLARDPAFRRALAAAEGAPPGSPEQQAVQDAVIAAQRSHPELDSWNWAAFDRRGLQVAAATLKPDENPDCEKAIGQPRWFRDYFHALGRDLDLGSVVRPPPLTAPHLSIVFLGQTTGEWLVGLSIPVAADGTADAGASGVLMMTVRVGDFARFLPRSLMADDLVASLIDRSPDSSGKPNTLLAHPALADPNIVARIAPDLPRRIHLSAGLPKAGRVASYADPFGGVEPGRYGGDWFAHLTTVSPSPAEGQSPKAAHWSVVVQRQSSTIGKPIDALNATLGRFGAACLGLIGLILAGLCGSFALTQTGAVRSRISALIRRRAGLATPAGSSRRSADPPGRVGGPAAPTLIEPTRLFTEPGGPDHGPGEPAPRTNAPIDPDADAPAADPAVASTVLLASEIEEPRPS